ncbi:MAG TPA: nucleotide pyrophosphohydrolase [Saprospiraceae bacterium]|nr:nucleotide pyrophosphohydrolase [Saprospiraceae bacterium]
MTIQEAQQKVDIWIRQYGGGYFSELTNLGILTEEVGEMARWMVRKYGDQNLKPGEQQTDMKAAIEDEMTDILWVLLCLANQMQIDLTTGFEQNILKKTNRDHSRHINDRTKQDPFPKTNI